MPTLAEKISIMQAALNGRPIEYKSRSYPKWCKSNDPTGLHWDWSSLDYRVAPTKTQDTMDWSQVSDDYKFGARDPDGKAFLYTERPTKGKNEWVPANNSKSFMITDMDGTPRLKGYIKGTTPWDESLIERPRT